MNTHTIKILLLCILLLSVVHSVKAEDIATARLKIDQIITVRGIVTNGLELGGIRYLQDETGGIAAYGYDQLLEVKAGDSIEVTGKLVEYNNLLEISPISSFQLLSSGNPVREPAVLTPAEIGEAYEAQLIKIKNVVFDNGGSLFGGNKSYYFTSNGETGEIRINNSSPIIGQIIPSEMIDLVAICSQYSYNNNDTETGYQLLPRTIDDFITDGSIHFTSSISVSNISKTGFRLSWRTSAAGTCEVDFGYEADEALLVNKVTGTVTADGDDFINVVDLTDLIPGSIVYTNAYTFDDTDTTSTSVKPYATQSNSSGNIKVFFNTEVDLSVSKGVDAVYLNRAIDDTLIAYIDRAQESIDFTIYNFNNSNLSNISDALNAAHARGIKVRIISCGTANNFAIDDLDPEVPELTSPGSDERDGIMHNKFIVFDAHSSNPNSPLVWTGATNFTDGQINTDPNNVIIIQDQSLALAYEIEFEEMWGSESETPNAENARFGSFKKDNTPHKFIIDGKNVECYFSPSDGTNQKLIEAINTTDHDLNISTMLITRSDIAYSIRDAKQRGVAVNILTNEIGGNSDLVNETLTTALGVQHFVYNEFVTGIMHHKYAIIDQDLPDSDPILITGSHNWSNAANDKNDENTLIIHDETIANIYYQQFVKIFLDNHGSFVEITDAPIAVNDNVSVNKNDLISIDVLANDDIQSTVDLSIQDEAIHGNSFIPFTNPNIISYQAQNDFVGKDSIKYKITYQTDPSLSSVATIYINVGTTGTINISNSAILKLYPNPVVNSLNISSSINIKSYSIYNIDGSRMIKNKVGLKKEISIELTHLQKGQYFIGITNTNDNLNILKFSKE